MKKFLKTGKKALSVFMAVMMVMTAWVFFEPMEASAATAGKYKIAFCVYENDNGTNGLSDLKIQYKTKANNGTGTESSVKTVTTSASDCLTHVSSGIEGGGSYYIVHVDNADFPSYLYAYGSCGNGQYPELRLRVLVAKAGASDCQGTETTTWKQVADFEFFHKNFGGSNSGSASTSSMANTPAVTSISFISGDASITVPKTNAASASYTYVAGVYDQYGVLMSCDPTYYVRTSAPTSVQTSSNTITGVSMSTAGEMTVTSEAQLETSDSQTVYVHAIYGTLYANKAVTLYDPYYTFSFKNTHGGTTYNPTANTTSQKRYYNTYGSTPSGTRTGFTFKGYFRDTDVEDSFATDNTSGKTKLDSGTYYIGDYNWYAAWQANQYTVTFAYKDASYNDASTSKTQYYSTDLTAPTIPTTINVGQDYTYTFKAWSPSVPATMPVVPESGITYTAQYNVETHYAELDVLNNAIAAAEDIINNDSIYQESGYTQESLDAFNNAYNAAVSLRDSNPLLSAQNTVDNAASLLNSIKLVKKQYTVLFVDESGAIIKDGYFYVDHGTKVTAPTAPEKDPDADYHYTFTGWDSTDSDPLSALDKVTDDLKFVANFTQEAHTLTETTTAVGCHGDTVTTKSCACGYTLTVPSDPAQHTWSDAKKQIIAPTCTSNGAEALYCTACGAVKEDSITPVDPLGHSFSDWTTDVEASCTQAGSKKRICSICNAEEVSTVSMLEHSYGDETKVAKTCTSDGYTTASCSVCGFTKIYDIDPATGHTLTEKTVAPTCVSIGYTEKKCTCGYCEMTYFDATGHTWGDWTTVSEPTCISKGVKQRTCTACGNVETIISDEVADHDTTDVEWVVHTDSTCTSEGYKTKTCKICGQVAEEETIPLKAHEYEAVVVDPTCVADGYTVHTCKNCGDSYTDAVVLATGHTPTTITKAATCTENGYTAEKCSACGVLLSDITTIPATGHKYNEGVVVREADAGNKGLIEYTCSACGDTFYEEYVVDSTVHQWKVEVIKAATCTEKGQEKYTCVKSDCTVCTADNKVSFTKEIPALGHDLTETVVAANCTDDGLKTVTCSRCDYEEVTVLPALGHDYQAGTPVDASCEASGYTPYKCSRCDAAYNELTAQPTGHDWDDGVVTQEPDTDKSGIKTYTCKNCAATKLETIAPIGPHVFTLVSETEADCENAGVREWKCTAHENCAADYTEVVPATGHNMVQDGDPVAATCESPELTTFKCDNGCGKTETIVTAPALGHDWGEWKTTTQATCSERGVETRTCKNDPTHIETRRTNTVGHDFVSTLYHPTCTESGFTILACKGCGKTIRTDFVPAYGHSYDEGVYEDATCTEPGGIRYTCTNTNPDGTACGYSYLVKDTEPLGHIWGEWHYVAHPTVDGAYAKQRDCTRAGCTAIEYERGKMENTDDINVYYKVEFMNPWTTDTYDTLNGGRTKLATGYKTTKVNEEYYLAGSEVTYPSNILPKREKDYDYGAYKLVDWTYDEVGQTDSALDDMKSIAANMTVYALFEGYEVYYTVAFWSDGKRLTKDQVILHGHTAQYPFDPPTKAENLQYKYEFTRWDYDWSTVYDSVAVCAQYQQIPKKYKIEYCDWNGTKLAEEEFEYSTAAKNAPTGLTRTADATYIYEFSGKWQTAPGKEEYIDLNHLTVPNGTEEGGTIKVYAKYYQKAKNYVVNIHGYGINGEIIPGATVQIFNSSGQIVTTAKLDSNSDVTVNLTYDTAYQITITDDSGNVGTTVPPIELNTTLKDEATGLLRPTEVTVRLTKYEDEHGGSDCHCICHSFLGRFWISMLNMIYRLFGKKIVCCYDMFATHGDQLIYGK